MRRGKSISRSDAAPAAGPSWQLQTAKARFSELFRMARTNGPQVVTRQGKEAVVVLPAEQFSELVDLARHRGTLVQFFRESPLAGLKLNFARERDAGREIEL
jgi:prevent-host-death family protein